MRDGRHVVAGRGAEENGQRGNSLCGASAHSNCALTGTETPKLRRAKEPAL
jgi:hypothetical protein